MHGTTVKMNFLLASVVKTVWYVLYKEITTAFCDNEREHVFKLCGGKFRVCESFDRGGIFK